MHNLLGLEKANKLSQRLKAREREGKKEPELGGGVDMDRIAALFPGRKGSEEKARGPGARCPLRPGPCRARWGSGPQKPLHVRAILLHLHGHEKERMAPQRHRMWPPTNAGRGRSREFIAGQQRGTRTEKEPFRESSESHQPETQTPQTGRPPGLAPSARRRTSGRRRTSAEPQSAQRTRGPGGTGFAGSRGFVFGEKANARRPSWALMGPRRPVRRSSAPRGPGENGPGYLNGKAQQHTNE